MKTVLITGGTGLIGEYLSHQLSNLGYRVSILSRNKKSNAIFKTFTWNYQKGEIDPEALNDLDYIIHLAGASIIDKKWSSKRKKEIIDSRVESTKFLFKTIKASSHQLKAFISASAIGYYGALTTDHIFIEDDPSGEDFLGKTCEKWESETDQFKQLNIRTVKIRIGIVLSDQGGALNKMIMPAKFHLASAFGNGNQYMPWIHINDLCNIFIKSIEDETIQDAYNASAPEHINNKDFTKILCQFLNKVYWLPNIPAKLINLVLGKRSVLLLEGSRISSKKIQETGFEFNFPTLKNALQNILTE